MRSGAYRHYVQFQRRSTQQDESGQQKNEWSTFANRKVSIEPISGSEFFTASGEHAEISVRVKCRYDPLIVTLHADDRMVFGTAIYNISQITPQIGRHDEIEILCANVDA